MTDHFAQFEVELTFQTIVSHEIHFAYCPRGTCSCAFLKKCDAVEFKIQTQNELDMDC